MTSSKTQGAQQVFDHAVLMIGSQPEAAASMLRDIHENERGPLSWAAGEQLISAYSALRNFPEALAVSEQLMRELGENPQSSYFWARVAIRRAENIIATGGSVSEFSSDLEQAELIFELNGDYYMIGRVAELKAAVSTSKGDYLKANEQAQRGQRLTVVHASSVTPTSGPSTSNTFELAGIGSGAQKN